MHSGSPYMVLLVGASTAASVKIVVAHDFPEKNLLSACFAINNLVHKLVFEKFEEKSYNLQEAELLISEKS